MSTIHTTTLTRELELSVRYIVEPAEPDVGAAADVEILSVHVCGVQIPPSVKLYDAIRADLREMEAMN